MENQNETKRKVLVPLKFSSSYFYSIEPDYNFAITSEMIRNEPMEKRYDALESEINLNEERNITTQIFRCCVSEYPVAKLLDLLDSKWDKLCWTERQIKAFVKSYGEKILFVLNVEESKLPNHLLFLVKNKKGAYLFVDVRFEIYSEKEFNYSIWFFENSPMSLFGFLVVPLPYSPQIIFEV